jgi:hypothetical protein
MNEKEHPRTKPDADRVTGKHGHSSYWKFVHHDWRFWVGLVFIFAAMFIYLMTGDLAWQPRLQTPPPQPGLINGK